MTSLASTIASLARGHAAITIPPPRNAIDSSEKPWGGAMPKKVPFEPWCPFPSATAAASDPNRNLTGSNGQACFWFSNGCAIGCEACDGNTRGPIPAFECVAGQDPKNCDVIPKPNHTIQFGPKAPICSNPLPATVCDPMQRTVNTHAECGAADDFFYYSPWRRPGSAPVIDPCGSAGGRHPGQGNGGFGAQYQDTTNAKVGDLGSKTLPVTSSGTKWTAGSTVEVAWTLQANHGGGYSYRLCPASSPLTEACFQLTPLSFAGPQSAFRWGGVDGKTHYYNRTMVGGAGTKSTSPIGSEWAMNPIPRAWKDPQGNWFNGWTAGSPEAVAAKRLGRVGVHHKMNSASKVGNAEGTVSNHLQTGYGFQPFCEDTPEYSCTSEWGPYNLEMVDKVVIPANLAAGAYVLGFRWDCEESNQIWQSCSDLEIIAA